MLLHCLLVEPNPADDCLHVLEDFSRTQSITCKPQKQTLSRLQVTRTERQSSSYLSGVVSRRLLHLVVETSGRFQVLRGEKKSSQWQNSILLVVGSVLLDDLVATGGPFKLLNRLPEL